MIDTQRRWVMNQLSRLQVMNPLSHTKNPVAAVATGLALVVIPASVAGAATGSQPHPSAVQADARVVSVSKATSATAPAEANLQPVSLYGSQSYIEPSTAQWDNAKAIVDVVQERKLPAYAAVVSVATALQESKLQNLDVAVDYDSLGLFQQRPSCGWGLPGQLVDPKYATNAFLDALQKAVPDYQETPLWQAAQATQQSAFPEAYAQWQDQATQMVQHILGGKGKI